MKRDPSLVRSAADAGRLPSLVPPRRLTPVEPTPAHPGVPRPPLEAGRGRQLFHAVLALAGWVLFVTWWKIVLGRVDLQQVRWTAIFVALTAVVVVALTVIWAVHNWVIYRSRGPRTRVRQVDESYVQDRLGRVLHFAGSDDALKHDPVILIRLEQRGKTYRPSSELGRTVPIFTVTKRSTAREPR